MAKKIIAVNAGPRKGWNTDTLVSEAARGAESAGAEVERFDLFKLEMFYRRAGDDHAVKAVVLDLVKGLVELGQVLFAGILRMMGHHLQQLDVHL